MAIVNIMFVEVFGMTDPLSYIEEKHLLMWYEILIAIVMMQLLMIDKQAWKHTFILAFAALCHFMIIYDLTIHSSFTSNMFYTWYDELIIMVGLLQMAISKNGILTALGNSLEFISRIGIHNRRSGESIALSVKGGKRS